MWLRSGAQLALAPPSLHLGSRHEPQPQMNAVSDHYTALKAHAHTSGGQPEGFCGLGDGEILVHTLILAHYYRHQ
jgi:hypothetical protein